MEPLNACDLHDPYFLWGQYAYAALDSSLELLDGSRWANLERYYKSGSALIKMKSVTSMHLHSLTMDRFT